MRRGSECIVPWILGSDSNHNEYALMSLDGQAILEGISPTSQDEEENLTYLRLITRAPDMYSAMKRFRERYEKHEILSTYLWIYLEFVRMIEFIETGSLYGDDELSIRDPLDEVNHSSQE